jgi:hypothetical protein
MITQSSTMRLLKHWQISQQHDVTTQKMETPFLILTFSKAQVTKFYP